MSLGQCLTLCAVSFCAGMATGFVVAAVWIGRKICGDGERAGQPPPRTGADPAGHPSPPLSREALAATDSWLAGVAAAVALVRVLVLARLRPRAHARGAVMDRRITIQTIQAICAKLSDDDLAAVFWMVSDYALALSVHVVEADLEVFTESEHPSGRRHHREESHARKISGRPSARIDTNDDDRAARILHRRI